MKNHLPLILAAAVLAVLAALAFTLITGINSGEVTTWR